MLFTIYRLWKLVDSKRKWTVETTDVPSAVLPFHMLKASAFKPGGKPLTQLALESSGRA